MRLKAGTCFIVLILVLTLAVIGLAVNFPYFDAKALPLLLGTVVAFLAVIQLARELKGKPRMEDATTKVSRCKSYSHHRFGSDSLGAGVKVR